ncbi:DNA (cytosine-5)-methyltransferase DRM2-like [Lolium rigidum]|uniref:DNA (cytosine-5)-methyltransferase DRM2-like n=1 Tax=Lolium rigidum TaxID=89674 RepID=UPI001F5C5365|nr:DNA (cytosine-5)-methyltransferase DRM2-like [Lolium rigidum]
MADSTSMMVDRFIEMGFPAEKVRKALEHAGGRQDEEAILEWLVAHQENDLSTDIEGFSSSSEGVDMADFDDKSLGAELTEKDRKFLYLVEMGFAEDEVSSCIDICGEHESVEVLADAIYAAQVDRRGGSYGGNFADRDLSADDKAIGTSGGVKRKNVGDPLGNKRRPHNKQFGQVDGAFCSGPVVGFDLPNESTSTSIAEGPPYFYFESLACSRQRVRDESPFLGKQPEFVDSKHFSVAARERSYIHNLPTLGRFHINPTQPKTIHGVFPETAKWWPAWDTRTQFNCFRTMTAPATVFKKMRLVLAKCDDHQVYCKKILDECKEWNLIWVGPKNVAALDPGEVEKVLGLPRDHTRGFKMTDRYWCLGNSVQVDTVAYHFSVLKAMFPSGIRVLSLFSGIGGAEVALGRLGINLKVVVSTESSEMNRNILRTWWDQSKQTGELIQIDDVQRLKGDYLETLVRRVGGFDLIIGGSPCTGGKGHNLVGNELEQSSVFGHYSLILEQVKQVMRRM